MLSPNEMVEKLADRHGTCQMFEDRRIDDNEGNFFWEVKVSIADVDGFQKFYGWVTDLGSGEDIIDAETGEPLYFAPETVEMMKRYGMTPPPA